MICMFGKGCASSFSRSASAGGQLAQPSEVNSSTSTGVGAWPDWALCACNFVTKKTNASSTSKTRGNLTRFIDFITLSKLKDSNTSSQVQMLGEQGSYI